MAREVKRRFKFYAKQSLEKNIRWSDKELKFIEEENIREIGRSIMILLRW